MILVNAVIPNTNEGKIVKAVIKASIFKESEYVLSPFADSDTVIASKPVDISWAETRLGKIKNIKT